MAGYLWKDYRQSSSVEFTSKEQGAGTVKDSIRAMFEAVGLTQDDPAARYNERDLMSVYLKSWLARRPIQTISLYAGGTVKFDVFKLHGEEKVPQVAHPLESLLRKPNPFCSGGRLVLQTIAYRFLSTKGAFWLISKDNEGVPRRIWLLPPHKVTVIPGNTADEFIRGYKYQYGENKSKIYTKDEVIYFQSFNPLNPYAGSSEITALAYVLETEWIRERRAYASQRGGHAAQAVYTTDSAPPDGETMATFKRYLAERHAGEKGTTEPLVLWYGLKRDQGFSPTEMKDIEQVLTARQIVSNEMGLSAAIGAENANRATIEGALREIVDVTLYPLCSLLAEDITLSCEFGALAHFGSDTLVEVRDFREKDNGFLVQQATLLKDGIVNAAGGRDPVITRDEFRALFGLPPWAKVADEGEQAGLLRQLLKEVHQQEHTIKELQKAIDDPFWNEKYP